VPAAAALFVSAADDAGTEAVQLIATGTDADIEAVRSISDSAPEVAGIDTGATVGGEVFTGIAARGQSQLMIQPPQVVFGQRETGRCLTVIRACGFGQDKQRPALLQIDCYASVPPRRRNGDGAEQAQIAQSPFAEQFEARLPACAGCKWQFAQNSLRSRAFKSVQVDGADADRCGPGTVGCSSAEQQDDQDSRNSDGAPPKGSGS